MGSEHAIKELLAYLDCPNVEVHDQSREVLHKQLSSVKESWLISGLLDYFITHNSSQALDLILSAPEHHDKYFLALVSDGLKQPMKRFQYTCLLFYGIRRCPPPTWIRILPRHQAIKDLLNSLNADSEAMTLVAGVMVVIVLVTAVPQEVGRNCLSSVLDMFWRMAHWTPKNPQDASITDYLRITMYSLFTRLYALYPCNVVNYIRTRTIGMYHKPFFLKTLQPMIERVRLHPMLFTYTKELELDIKSSPVRDSTFALMECNRMSLDAIESTCEDPPLVTDPEVCTSVFLGSGTKCWVHSTLESFFWSPSHNQSPVPTRLELPSTSVHTPITTPMTTPIFTPNYTRTPLRVSMSSSAIPESPPEAAIEATPETTPYTTPMLSEHNRRLLVESIKKSSTTDAVTSVTSGQASGINEVTYKSLQPKRKSAMMNKLSAVKKDREETLSVQSTNISGIQNEKVADDPMVTPDVDYSNTKNLAVSQKKINEGEFSALRTISDDIPALDDPCLDVAKNGFDSSSSSALESGESHKPTNLRKSSDGSRQRSVFVEPPLDMLQFAASEATSETTKDSSAEREPETDLQISTKSEENDNAANHEGEERKSSCDANFHGIEGDDAEEQGIGPPPVKSINELVKTAKSIRLRFLSQRGPPLNMAQIESIMPDEKKDNKNDVATRSRNRSKSCSSFVPSDSPAANSGDKTPAKKSTDRMGNTTACKSEAETQTLASSVIDPYEKLVDTFLTTVNVPKRKNDVNGSDVETLSPHILLQNYIQRKIIDCSEPLTGFDLSRVKNGDDRLKNQLYAMYSLLLLERHKREIHATRNRRLLEKSKQLHVLLEQRKGLTSKASALSDDMYNLKSTNIYLSSCYQRMKDYRDRDNIEKEAILKQYSEGKSLDDLPGTVLTSLSRTVKTSKGEVAKEKIIVIIHQPTQHDEDKFKDQLVKVNEALRGNVGHLTNANFKLHQRVLELEQEASKYKTEQENIEVLQQEKEVMRQHMAVMKIQLTLKDELNLEACERVNELEDTIFDEHSKNRQDMEMWTEHERKFSCDDLALRGLVSASNLRCSQLEQKLREQEAEYEQRLKKVAEDSTKSRKKAEMLQQNSEDVKKQNEELEVYLMKVTAERNLLTKELEVLASRSGFCRSSGEAVPPSSAAWPVENQFVLPSATTNATSTTTAAAVASSRIGAAPKAARTAAGAAALTSVSAASFSSTTSSNFLVSPGMSRAKALSIAARGSPASATGSPGGAGAMPASTAPPVSYLQNLSSDLNPLWLPNVPSHKSTKNKYLPT
uniref:Hamartin-like n=1 Tax=Hirondellea gigas TaxID=1518452 RepID=A0A2P2I5W0_9CRUS